MKVFTIENDNNITVHASVQDAESMANAERFRNETGLAKLAADWPAARLVDIWNSLPGATRVNKFTSKKAAIARIWKAIQSLGTPVLADDAERPETASDLAATSAPDGPQTSDVAPVEAPAAKKATRAKGPSKAPTKASGSRAGSKTAQVVAMLQRKGGATLVEIMETMGWQRHTVRGFMAGAMKKAGYTVESFKPEGGERTYRINA